jgi:hypothetical protein
VESGILLKKNLVESGKLAKKIWWKLILELNLQEK